MKKISLIMVLTLVMLCAFAAVALAGSGPHGDYTADTDACASCHSAHNAVEGSTLLLWNDATEACLFCHNGTISKFNVVKGEFKDGGQAVPTHGGLFAVKADGINAAAASASQHDVFSSYGQAAIINAPGGKGTAGKDGYGSWTDGEELTCGSCHEPHGAGGNPRLLNTNPNGTQNLPVNQVRNLQLGTKEFTDLATTPTFYFKDGKSNIISYTDKNSNGKYDSSDTDLVTSVTDGSTPPKYLLDSDLTNKLRPILTDPSNAPVKVYVGGTLIDFAKYIVGYDTNGVYVKFVSDPGKTGVVTVDYTAGIQVVMNFTDKGTINEKIVYGAGMQEFCAACHTDYAGSRSRSVAVYDKVNPYHHSGNRPNSSGGNTFPQLGNYTGTVAGTINPATGKPAVAGVDASVGSCLTCHYSHGVDQGVWAKTADATGIQAYNSPELSGSSSLKRLPNMGTCEVCHRWGAKSYSPANKFVLGVNPLDSTKQVWKNPNQ